MVKWTPECVTAFDDLKKCLYNDPLLCPGFELPFTVQTDTSQWGSKVFLCWGKSRERGLWTLWSIISFGSLGLRSTIAMQWIFWLKDTNAKNYTMVSFPGAFSVPDHCHLPISLTISTSLFCLSFRLSRILLSKHYCTSYYPSSPCISPYIQLKLPPSSNFIPWWQTNTCFSYFYYIFHYTALEIQHENFFV